MAKKDAVPADLAHFNPVVPEGAKVPDFANWTPEQIGFAPYWNPAPGKWFVGVLTDVDMRDPKFTRYQFEALLDTPCQRGPADEDNDRHEKVMVNTGEKFSISAYSGLTPLFQEYIDAPFPVQIRVMADKKGKTSEGQDFWHFKVDVSPESRKLLTKFRETKKLEAKKTRPALET